MKIKLSKQARKFIKRTNQKLETRISKEISKIATKIAKLFLNVEPKDPMSGFFAFKKNILKNSKFDLLGYKILLEMLVKTKNVKISSNNTTQFTHGKKMIKKRMNIIDKAESLTPAEWRQIQAHTVIGQRLLENIPKAH